MDLLCQVLSYGLQTALLISQPLRQYFASVLPFLSSPSRNPPQPRYFHDIKGHWTVVVPLIFTFVQTPSISPLQVPAILIQGSSKNLYRFFALFSRPSASHGKNCGATDAHAARARHLPSPPLVDHFMLHSSPSPFARMRADDDTDGGNFTVIKQEPTMILRRGVLIRGWRLVGYRQTTVEGHEKPKLGVGLQNERSWLGWYWRA